MWWAFSLYGVLLCVAGVGSSSAAILQDVSESVSSQSNDEPPREVATARMSPCVCSCVPIASQPLLISLARSRPPLAESGTLLRFTAV